MFIYQQDDQLKFKFNIDPEKDALIILKEDDEAKTEPELSK